MKQRKPMTRSTPLRRSDGSARLTVLVFKPKKCKVCRSRFTPTRPMQPVCAEIACGVSYAEKLLEAKKARARAADLKWIRERKAEIAPISHWEKKAEAAVNRYVRLRDANDGCISCHLPATWDGQWHASHYRSVGAATAVRFNLWNIHKACSVCNKWKSGNLADYDPRIRQKIGDAKVDWLKTQNQVVRYSREYLERLARVFNKKARRMEARLR